MQKTSRIVYRVDELHRRHALLLLRFQGPGKLGTISKMAYRLSRWQSKERLLRTRASNTCYTCYTCYTQALSSPYQVALTAHAANGRPNAMRCT